MTSNVKRDFLPPLSKEKLVFTSITLLKTFHSSSDTPGQHLWTNLIVIFWKITFTFQLQGYSPLVASIGDKMQCRACLCWYLSKISIGWRRLSSIFGLPEKQTNKQPKVEQEPDFAWKKKLNKNLFLPRQKGRTTNKEKVTNNLSLSHLCFSPRVWMSIKATTKKKLKRTFNCGKKRSIINGLISQIMAQGQTWYLVW